MPHRALFLHGFAGGPLGFQAITQALGPDWDCVCPELPGHGQGERSRRPCSFETGIADFAASLRPVFDGPGRRLHLFGYSLGARTALGLLACCPQHFVSATLVGVHPGLDTDSERRARLDSDRHWIRLLRSEGLEAFCKAWEEQPLFDTQKALSDGALAAQRTTRRLNTAGGLAWSLETFGLAAMPSLARYFREPPVPTHLIVGELDSKFRALAERIKAENPEIRLTVIPQTGHNPVLEQPVALARAFVKGASI